jgi:hypothetical protein
MSEYIDLSNASSTGRKGYKTSTVFSSWFLQRSTILSPPLSYIVNMQSFAVLLALLATATFAFAAPAPWSPPGSGSQSGSAGSSDPYGSSSAPAAGGAGAGGAGAGSGAGPAASPCGDPSAGGLGKILDPTLCGVTDTVNKLCTTSIR